MTSPAAPTGPTTATDVEPPPTDTKPTETVDFWKQKAREQEQRAKSNADAAKRLAELEDAQKTEAQKAADKLAAADAEVASVPAKVSEALRTHLVDLHSIPDEDAELFLTATDPALLLRQVTGLLARGNSNDERRRRNGNHVPREGSTPPATDDPKRAFARQVFSGST